MVNKGVVIDVFSDIKVKEDVLTDYTIIELIFSFVGKNLPKEFKELLLRIVSIDSDLDSKIKTLVTELKEFVGRGLIATDLEEIFHTIIKRSRIMFEYRTQKKNKFSTKLKETLDKKWAKKTGKLLVIKGFESFETQDVEQIRDIYLLPNNIFEYEFSINEIFVKEINVYF